MSVCGENNKKMQDKGNAPIRISSLIITLFVKGISQCVGVTIIASVIYRVIWNHAWSRNICFDCLAGCFAIASVRSVRLAYLKQDAIIIVNWFVRRQVPLENVVNVKGYGWLLPMIWIYFNGNARVRRIVLIYPPVDDYEMVMNSLSLVVAQNRTKEAAVIAEP